MGFYLLHFSAFDDSFSVYYEENMYGGMKWVFAIGVFIIFSVEGFVSSQFPSNRIINQVQAGNRNEVFNAFMEAGVSVQQIETPFSMLQKFLESLIEEINSQYGISLTKKDACRLIRENLHLISLPSESSSSLFSVIQLLEFEVSEDVSQLENPFLREAQASVFGYGLYWPWDWNWFGLNKKHHKSSKSSSQVCQNRVELELPPKMAAGFMCALGGALICILPGGQAIGLTLMGTGLSLALDGMANGERPYYIEKGPQQK